MGSANHIYENTILITIQIIGTENNVDFGICDLLKKYRIFKAYIYMKNKV